MVDPVLFQNNIRTQILVWILKDLIAGSRYDVATRFLAVVPGLGQSRCQRLCSTLDACDFRSGQRIRWWVGWPHYFPCNLTFVTKHFCQMLEKASLLITCHYLIIDQISTLYAVLSYMLTYVRKYRRMTSTYRFQI